METTLSHPREEEDEDSLLKKTLYLVFAVIFITMATLALRRDAAFSMREAIVGAIKGRRSIFQYEEKIPLLCPVMEITGDEMASNAMSRGFGHG